ncbi:MAG: hypothetical protein IJ870_03960 [Alphaproteobacteria bacterium]|nr:hypothetical protein [Alphaproteobacteria bacterium]
MQKNKQIVFFKDTAGNWWENQIDLKDVYTRIHSAGTKYGSSADMLLSEMMANVLELAKENRIDLKKEVVITDYGCGKSKAANVVGKTLANHAAKISGMFGKGKSLKQVMSFIAPLLKRENALPVEDLKQVETYGNITVQRYDIGVKAFSTPLSRYADVVFCNDVFEHIPEVDLPDFITALEASGKYIFASISLRDAVNYSPLEESLVMRGAKPCEEKPKGGIVLERDASGAYIFSLHVSVFPKAKWQEILGEKWHLLPAQDYTAVSAVNFLPSAKYQTYKKALIAKVGFADFIAFPTPVGTRYESDPILLRRVAMMQEEKHKMKLQALKEYPNGAFRRSEEEKSLAFLKFIGATPASCHGYLEKLLELERVAKKMAREENPNPTDELISQIAENIIRNF